MGRPRTRIGEWGEINTVPSRGKFKAEVWIRDNDGKLRRIRRWANSSAAARRALQRTLQERHVQSGPIKGETSLGQLAELWGDTFDAQKFSAGTRETYTKVAKKISEHLGSVSIKEVTAGLLERQLAEIAQTTPSMAKTMHTVLRKMFQLAVKHEARKDNPMLNVSPVGVTKKPVRTLSVEEYIKFRAYIGQKMTRSAKHGRKRPTTSLDVTDMLIGTGLRPGEAFAIGVEDLDVENWTVNIHRTAISVSGQGMIIQEHTKTNDRVILRIPIFLRPMIQRRLNEPMVQKSGLLFPSERGTVMDPGGHSKIFRNAVKDSEWAWVTPRVARSAVATLLHDKEGLEAAQGQLRHKPGSAITLQHYVQKNTKIVDFSDVLEAFAANSSEDL